MKNKQKIFNSDFFIFLIFAIFVGFAYMHCRNNIVHNNRNTYNMVTIIYEDRLGEKIFKTYKDTLVVAKLNRLKNNSRKKLSFLTSINGREYTITLVYKDSTKKEKTQYIKIYKDFELEPTIIYGDHFVSNLFSVNYKNDELINYVISLINDPTKN